MVRSPVLAILAGFLGTPNAHGATLSMYWQGTMNRTVSARIGEPVVVDVFIDMVPNASLSEVYARLEGPYPFPLTNLRHVQSTALLPGWEVGGVVDELIGTAEFRVFASDPVADGVFTDEFVRLHVGSFTLQFDQPRGLGSRDELLFDYHGFFPADTDPQRTGLIDAAGQSYIYNLSGTYASYSGYFTFGRGHPNVWAMMEPTRRDPLRIVEVPEPSSLRLLALSGIAVFLRSTCDQN